MTDTLLLTIGTILGAIVSGGVSYAVAKTNAKATQTTATLPPYEQLAKRVSDLERADEDKGRIIDQLKGRLTMVITDRDSLVAYVKDWARWAMAGAAPPPPAMPTHLRDLFDPDEWEATEVTMRRVEPRHEMTTEIIEED